VFTTTTGQRLSVPGAHRATGTGSRACFQFVTTTTGPRWFPPRAVVARGGTGRGVCRSGEDTNWPRLSAPVAVVAAGATYFDVLVFVLAPTNDRSPAARSGRAFVRM